MEKRGNKENWWENVLVRKYAVMVVEKVLGKQVDTRTTGNGIGGEKRKGGTHSNQDGHWKEEP